MSFYKKLGFLAATSIALVSVSIASLSLFQSKLIYMPRTYDQMFHYYSRFLSRKDIKPFQFYNIVNSHTETHTAYHMSITPEQSSYSSNNIRLFLMFGGNAALALDFVPVIDQYKQYVKSLGIIDYIIPTHFLLIDYPGYNHNPGEPSPKSILKSTELALKQLIKDQQWKNKVIKLGFAAHSLGCASSLQFADLITRNNNTNNNTLTDMKEIANFSDNNSVMVDKIILLSPFTTMLEMAQTLIGRIPFLNYLLNHNFDNIYHLAHFIQNAEDKQKKLKNNSKDNNSDHKVSESDKIQLLIIHGDRDRIVPVEMGRQLALIASNPEFSHLITCNYLELEGVDHNDIFSHAETKMFEVMVDNEFVNQ